MTCTAFALRIVALVLGAVLVLAGLSCVRADSHRSVQRPIVVQFHPVTGGIA